MGFGAFVPCWWEKVGRSVASRFSVSGEKKALKWHLNPRGNPAREILRGCLRKQLILIMSGPGILFLIEQTRAAPSKC